MIEEYKILKHYKNELTKQQYRTLKGQINKGDYIGFRKGLETILKRKDVLYEK